MKLWRIFGQVQNKKTDCKFILCPVCGNKTHTMIRENTELKNFPLYCPKCKKETIINVRDMKITLAECKQNH